MIGSKCACEKEMLMEKLQIDIEMEVLARGTSASLGVGDDCRVVQRVKLYMCVRGHLTAQRNICSVRDRNKSEGEKEG